MNYPKTKLEDGILGDTPHRIVPKRRTSHQSTEHELEVDEFAESLFSSIVFEQFNCFSRLDFRIMCTTAVLISYLVYYFVQNMANCVISYFLYVMLIHIQCCI